MNSKQILKKLKQAGWEHVRTTGDHWHFKHSELPEICTAPHPKKDLPIGTLRSIEKQARLKLR